MAVEVSRDEQFIRDIQYVGLASLSGHTEKNLSDLAVVALSTIHDEAASRAAVLDELVRAKVRVRKFHQLESLKADAWMQTLYQATTQDLTSLSEVIVSDLRQQVSIVWNDAGRTVRVKDSPAMQAAARVAQLAYELAQKVNTKKPL